MKAICFYIIKTTFHLFIGINCSLSEVNHYPGKWKILSRKLWFSNSCNAIIFLFMFCITYFKLPRKKYIYFFALFQSPAKIKNKKIKKGKGNCTQVTQTSEASDLNLLGRRYREKKKILNLLQHMCLVLCLPMHWVYTVSLYFLHWNHYIIILSYKWLGKKKYLPFIFYYCLVLFLLRSLPYIESF